MLYPVFRQLGFAVLALLFLLAFFGAPTARACSCGPRPTVLEAYERADHVIIVQVVEFQKSQETPNRILSTRTRVERIFKGSLAIGEEVNISQGSSEICIFGFHEADLGKRFLFYFREPQRGNNNQPLRWGTNVCNRQNRLEAVGDDLLFLEKRESVAGKTRLSGTLRSSQGEASGLPPMSGNKVRVIGEKKTYELTTDANGAYEIYDLPAGEYTVEAEVPDSYLLHYSRVSKSPPVMRGDKPLPSLRENRQRVIVESGKHAFTDYFYTFRNAIRGRVLDTAGRGMPNVYLQLVPADTQTESFGHGSAYTDAGGNFAITGMSPGNYLIVLNREGKISSRQPFPTVYYPGALEREKASPVSIGRFDTIEGTNINIPRLAETVTVEGVYRYADGQAVSDEVIEFTTDKVLDGIEGVAQTSTDANGRFTLRVLRGAQGKLYGRFVALAGEFENCPAIEKLIKKAGGTQVEIKTNVVSLRTDHSLADVELRLSLPFCRKASGSK